MSNHNNNNEYDNEMIDACVMHAQRIVLIDAL